jgi:hypothetical protein
MKSIYLAFTNGDTRRIYSVQEHQYMTTSQTLKVVTDGRTYYFPLRNLNEIEVVYV